MHKDFNISQCKQIQAYLNIKGEESNSLMNT